MKILIFSDSHLSFDKLVKMAQIENPDVILCAGDHSRDALELSYVEETPKYYIVRGNCDSFDHSFKDILQFQLLEKKFYLTHGHLHGVKMTLEKLKIETKDLEVNIVIFGHTHIPYYEISNGIHYFNPGSARDGNYGVLILDDLNTNFIHKNINKEMI